MNVSYVVPWFWSRLRPCHVRYLLVLLPGFALWVAYGVASHDAALVIPNVLALIVATGTVICALQLRHGRVG
jgi:hypothetical protein